jgi:hypothetical protein
MADGGGMQPVRPAPSPWSIAGIANTVKSAIAPAPRTPQQIEYERGLAEYKAKSAAERAAPQPVAVAPAPVAPNPQVIAPQPVYNQGENVLIQRQKLLGMKNGGEFSSGARPASLRVFSDMYGDSGTGAPFTAYTPDKDGAVVYPQLQHLERTGVGMENGGSVEIDEGMGGPVPGQGQGDKIPAKYEPGEFVVSNDMLDNAPGLREDLHDLRAQTLADKGMSVDEADAKAVRPKSLRAASGFMMPDDQIPPHNQNGAGPAGNIGTGVPAVGGVPQSPTGPVSNFMPATRATLRGSGEDISAAVNSGNYGAALGHTVRGAATLPVAFADDVLGNASRSAYGLLKGPVEDAGRAALGLPDRQPDAAPRPSLRTNARGQGFDDPRVIGKTDTSGGPPPGISGGGTAMSADDPGMRSIQARQDEGDRARATQAQYNADVVQAQAINEDGRRLNLEYSARSGDRGARRALDRDAALTQIKNQNDTQIKVANIGADAQMYGANVNAKTARAVALRDAYYKDREFNAQRSDKAHEQDRAAEDDFQKHAVEATTTVGPDGKPMQDPAAAADYMRTVRHTIAQTIQDPNTPPVVREKLKSKGLAGLDAADRAAMMNLYKTRQIQTADHSGLNPFKSKGDVSDDLRDYVPKGSDNTLLQKRLRNNMGSVPVNALEYGPGRNTILWNSGPADQTLIPKNLRD